MSNSTHKAKIADPEVIEKIAKFMGDLCETYDPEMIEGICLSLIGMNIVANEKLNAVVSPMSRVQEGVDPTTNIPDFVFALQVIPTAKLDEHMIGYYKMMDDVVDNMETTESKLSVVPDLKISETVDPALIAKAPTEAQ